MTDPGSLSGHPRDVTISPAGSTTATLEGDTAPAAQLKQPQPKSRAFYLTFLAISVTTFLSAIDLTAVGTALPTISAALHDTRGDFTWVGSAYALSSTAFIPLSGNLADAFGRRVVVLFSILFFAIGSALSGAAQNMNMLIAARTVQGVGGGGILALSEILVADLVPLAERGIYQGFLALIWSLASSVGPPIGGALANKGTKAWRWLFFLNLPLCGISFLLVAFFLRVRSPPGSIQSKLAQVDWLGNLIVIAGTTLAIVGLTFGGIRFPWASAQVLAPLVIGFVLLIVFGFYEVYLVTDPVRPTTPADIMSNRTSLGGLLGTAIHGLVSVALIYYLPGHLLPSLLLRLADPLRGRLPPLRAAHRAVRVRGGRDHDRDREIPAGQLRRVVFRHHRLCRNSAISFLTLLSRASACSRCSKQTRARAAGWGSRCSRASGWGCSSPAPSSRSSPRSRRAAPPPRSRSGRSHAPSSRRGASPSRRPSSRTSCRPPSRRRSPRSSPAGFEIAYAAIPVIRTLDAPLKTEVQAAFAESMAAVWQTMTGISGIGLLSCLLLREIPMVQGIDETYALKEENAKVNDREKQ
ncbi:Iron permease [Mycena indigotica]|uniref:Iron permease n=1 Tax=Mycena indigotica TaxID=2126181 RepID=A0A8H6W8X7_9AGAR|nr:Iron permease [Mycena indigotica]KAF7310094.1 Iron permease [Mycena indigotica]